MFLFFAQARGLTPEEIVEDEEFFDVATSTSEKGYPLWVPAPDGGKRDAPIKPAQTQFLNAKPQPKRTGKPTKKEQT